MQYRLSTRFRTDATGRRLPAAGTPEIDAAAHAYRARDYETAARLCDETLRRHRHNFDALHLSGVLRLHQEKPEQALAYLRKAEQVQPDVPRLQFHIGNALLAQRRWDEAAASFRRALDLQPDDFDALNNLGNALAGDFRYADALTYYRQAVSVRPNAPEALYNLGKTLLALDQPEAAEPSLRSALAAAGPDVPASKLADLYNSHCEILVRQGRYTEALALFRAAPAAIMDEPALRWNESLTLLMLGQYAEGWRKYESRFLVTGHDPPRAGASLLDLDEVAGKRVLVFAEQGRGDMIQFARYLPLLAARGAIVLVETYPDLMPLFETIDGVTQLMPLDAPPPDHDRLTPFLSLPLAFDTTLATIPAQVPYLRVSDAHAARWNAWLGLHTCPRIGIAWWGSQHIARRSMSLATLAPVLRLPGVEFHALQKEIPTGDRDWIDSHADLADHTEQLDDFADTAALIARMDLVISIDTAVAHLAGALGVPVWIMLPFSPDWRWLPDRDDSPWYPTVRLFRQTRRGDWDDVVRRVAAALSAWPSSAHPVIARSEATKQSPP